MMNRTMIAADLDDAVLVERSKRGDREAFGQLVERYQRLVASLTYSGVGNLALSEDIAQETFVAAWRNLSNLREPAKLRSWLCGIARNLIHNAVRKHGVERPAPIEEIAESPSPEAAPAEQAVTREEAELLWRSLERIPETYREPMILFYREQQSIEKVAEDLELSEDAVKQRLSRGRKLLQDELATFVEGALCRSAPGRAFTIGVIAALPAFALSASAATVGAGAAKAGSTAAGATAVSVAGMIAGPVIGVAGAYVGAKASLDAARTPRERAFVKSKIKQMIVIAVLFNALIFSFVFVAPKFWKTHPIVLIAAGIGIPIVFTIYIVISAFRYNAQASKLREEERMANPSAFSPDDFGIKPREFRSKASLLGLPLIHCLSGDPKRAAMGWIAIGDRAYGILFAGGGLAVGGIAMGGAAIGLISLGGAALGFLALGGLAIGSYAIGGAALGMIAAGGLGVGLLGAHGGLAVARDFAMGGLAVAANANNDAARAFFADYAWMDVSKYTVWNSMTFVVWLPILLVVFWARRAKKSAR